jgi:predicted dehydrogenase
MINVAIVRGAGSYHGRAFAGILNEYDEAAYRERGWPAYPSALAARARVTHVWDPDRDAAEQLAAAAGIDSVAGRPEDVIGQVDGVIVADDGSLEHQRSARPFLEAGLPTFVDKPLSTDPAEAREIVELARRHGAPFFSASALRFAEEIRDRDALAAQVGEITAVCAAGVNDLVYYGVHPLEAMVALLGPGIESVANVGRPGEAVVRLRWRDGRQGVMLVYERGFSYTLEVTLHGTAGHARIPISDSAAYYTNMLGAFLDMVESGEPPFAAEETVEIIRALVLARESVADGGVERRL